MGVMKMADFAVVTHCLEDSAGCRPLIHQSLSVARDTPGEPVQAEQSH